MPRGRTSAPYTELVAQGYGAGILTCAEGVSGATPLIVREIWLLGLPDLRRNATVRKALDWIAATTKGEAASLSGSAAAAKLGEGWSRSR